ncbi:MAG: DNA polymerase III subunit delta [Gammaproteobacteria bacterium]|nr:DNA polymerase III subunit delta [Gammaproteobacteria bacterium]
MKIKTEHLARTLNAGAHPVYWLSGDEPLLLQESADQIRRHHREAGFADRETYNVDRNFNWAHFRQSTGNLSLFAERKFVELRLHQAKLEDDGKLALADFLETGARDLVILISSPKLESSLMQTKWFKSIESRSVVIQVWPIDREGLPGWLERRMLRANIHPEPDALQILIDRVEGNLLAAAQEIEKLKLLAGTNDTIKLDVQTVMQVVADNSRYNAYQLVDAALLGNLARIQKILNGLQAEGVYPLVILGAITRELRILQPMVEKRENGQPLTSILQTSRIFFNRKQPVKAAVSRLSSPLIWELLKQARLVDQACKGICSANPWDELSMLLIRLSGSQVCTATTPCMI